MVAIFVETTIHGAMETLWQRTQEPHWHQQWDLRFTDITYLPQDADGLQRFHYRTRLGFGVAIDGAGESRTAIDDDTGVRTSSLRFWSDQRRSLIREGGGYWRYRPVAAGGVRFLTRYDYQVRWGRAGRLFDRVLFRPLIGWATAWSFDALRLWIEDGRHPTASLRMAIVYTIARLLIVFIWLWHGIVPKLIVRHPDEALPLTAAGFSTDTAWALVMVAGWLEVGIAVVVLAGWRWLWPLWLTVFGMAMAIIGVATTAPSLFLHAFNPFTFSLTVAGLASVAAILHAEVPRAGRCLRRPAPDVDS